MNAPSHSGPVLAADGTPLKKSLNRALRMQKIRALALIAPLLLFILLTFIAPIAEMLMRSVENQIVSDTLPRTVAALHDWDPDGGELPDAAVFDALYEDLFVATEMKAHTRLGSRLNYETVGMSSLFRKSGRAVDKMGELYLDQFKDLDRDWDKDTPWATLMASPDYLAAAERWQADRKAAKAAGHDFSALPPKFSAAPGIADLLPKTTEAYGIFAAFLRSEDDKTVLDDEPWSLVHTALYTDLIAAPDAAIAAYAGPGADRLAAAKAAVAGFETATRKDQFIEADEDWADLDIWRTIRVYSPRYTPGYFLNAVDMQLGADGITAKPEDQQIYLMLFRRTLIMSLAITASCIVLGYPVAWLLANLPMRSANLLMILVLLPFWTSLLVRTSAWKVMLQ
ncbi:MAG: ABC transporter permease, partial [Rhodobacteraceae bacterium]|nr:ABC transporter permease [Paracoccaceae bacterium]